MRGIHAHSIQAIQAQRQRVEYREHEKLVEGLAQQRVEYRELRRKYLQLSEDMNRKLHRLAIAEGKEHLLAE